MGTVRKIDFERVSQALKRLDELALKYPHLVDKDNPSSGDDWYETLKEAGLDDDNDERIEKAKTTEFKKF